MPVCSLSLCNWSILKDCQLHQFSRSCKFPLGLPIKLLSTHDKFLWFYSCTIRHHTLCIHCHRRPYIPAECHNPDTLLHSGKSCQNKNGIYLYRKFYSCFHGPICKFCKIRIPAMFHCLLRFSGQYSNRKFYK